MRPAVALAMLLCFAVTPTLAQQKQRKSLTPEPIPAAEKIASVEECLKRQSVTPGAAAPPVPPSATPTTPAAPAATPAAGSSDANTKLDLVLRCMQAQIELLQRIRAAQFVTPVVADDGQGIGLCEQMGLRNVGSAIVDYKRDKALNEPQQRVLICAPK